MAGESCSTGHCGIGGWGGPLPGDPSNDIIFNANAVWGGIELSWTLPGTNPYALAYVLLYRGTTSVFENAVQIAAVANNRYIDPVNVEGLYYYWMQAVSINGTVSAAIGPATANPELRVTQIMQELTGQIDQSVLAIALREEIDKITLNADGIAAEILNRLDEDSALASAIADVQSGVDQSLAFIAEEQTTREDGDNALASQINIIGALNADNAAAIITETTARVTADSAMASQITSLFTATGNNATAITNEITARTNADSALASNISTVQSTAASNLAAVQVTLQTNINTVDDKVDDIGALYTVNVTVNGLVGGFGIYNNGTTIDAGFDVDTFWVGKTNANKVKPFIITGGVVYIDSARIANAAITTAHIANLAVTRGKIANLAVDTAQINTAAITNAKIGNLAVDTLNIAGAAVTAASIGVGAGGTIPAGGSLVGASVTIDMTNRDASSTVVIIANSNISAAAGDTTLVIEIAKSGGSNISGAYVGFHNGYTRDFSIIGVDFSPNNGSNTYTITYTNPTTGAGSNRATTLTNSRMVATGGKR